MPVKKQTDLEIQPRRPRGRPKAQDLAELEGRLISVGRQIFFREGYGATTMDAVATAARVSKGTLYTRFPSKEALFRAIAQEQMTRWGEGDSAQPLALSETLQVTLGRYGDLWLRAALSEDFVHMSRLRFSESARFPELGEAYQMAFDQGVDAITEVIRRFAEKDAIPCNDPQAAARVFQLTIGGWVYNAILSNAPFKPAVAKVWLDNTVRIFVAGRAAW